MNDIFFSVPRLLLERMPAARALVRGCETCPNLQGEVLFFPFRNGSIVSATLSGIPYSGFLGFHIHENASCATGGDIPFHGAGGHYNPTGAQHPNHAGDLPVLLASGGFSYAVFFTDRFTPAQVVGRSVVLHGKPDDFRTQPAGDSGSRIACGVIRAL